MTLCFFGPIPLGWQGSGGPPPITSFQRRGPIRYHDHQISLGFPATQFLGYDLIKIQLQVQLWTPYTISPAECFQALATVRDLRIPLPLFVGNQLAGRGASLFTLRSVNEQWEIINGPVLKAKAELELVEFANQLTGNSYFQIVNALLAL